MTTPGFPKLQVMSSTRGKAPAPPLVLLCSDIYGAALKTRIDVAVAEN